MTPLSFLTDFYCQRLNDVYNPTALDQLFKAFLNNHSLDNSLVSLVLEEDTLTPLYCQKKSEKERSDNKLEIVNTSTTPWDLVKQWRNLFVIVLILHERSCLQEFRHAITAKIKALESVGLWTEFQLISSYQTIVKAIALDQHAKMPVFQLPSGAAPLEAGEHWSWASIPHPNYHAELGALWCFYGSFYNDQRVLSAAEYLADWQQCTLNHEGIPHVGLFSHEGDTAEENLLINNYILFDSIARQCSRADIAAIANIQKEKLQLIMPLNGKMIHPLYVILENWHARACPYLIGLQNDAVIENNKSLFQQFPSNYQDLNLAFAGCRNSNSSAVATLFGGGSGMGSFCREEIQIVSFGPQNGPLGDCRGYGLESGADLSKHIKVINSTADQFSIEGLTRLRSIPQEKTSLANYREGIHACVWIDSKLEFNENKFSISLTFNDFNDLDLSFAFFVKASHCIIDGKQTVQPRSLQHYWGDIHRVDLQGRKEMLSIKADHQGEMHVIPLGGGEDFWGADFLIAYTCKNDLKQYHWSIQ